jgi:hypothetical protein
MATQPAHGRDRAWKRRCSVFDALDGLQLRSKTEGARARRRQGAGSLVQQASALRELRRQAVLELLKPKEATVRSVAIELGVSPTTIQDIKTSYPGPEGTERRRPPRNEERPSGVVTARP